ncbi:uncharacterized protein KY384_000950 [Bacidia gigantensis]|uniref:uncharacterized protein n=1 Tax=Bacidia gigantensis TaxID=2732470 RepID=UPI001D045CC8|nr:uncharacterized protein KY384_000950 [Bacidia gigantensis]KAG8534106.1 hypothetical protein KY384_000950 [Bacidia gigantensis]
MRRTSLTSVLGLLAFVGFTLYLLRSHRDRKHFHAPLPELTKEIAPSTETSHPIHQLITKAQDDHEQLLNKQSDSLQKAVEEYRRRYLLPPPPNFDKWWEFAKARNVQLIDEYDTIYHSLLPFWGLQPRDVRSRAREALGFDNALLGVYVRDGKVVTAAGGTEWQQQSTIGMLKEFVQYLPNIDLPFNVHDEPRVVVPHDDLSRLLVVANNKIAATSGSSAPKNAWSPPSEELGDGTRAYEVKTTRFNKYAHQPTWTESRMSCSPDSPARFLDEAPQDDSSSFTFSQLGFIKNKTAFSDICLSPSLREHFGFFDRPNAFNIVHDLFPIFSQSKVSSYQDILYPSPWYWSDKVPYKEENDYAWDQKQNKVYWRGSTTGGFSRDGGWRRQHRQQFVDKFNGRTNATIMVNEGGAGWTTKDVPRKDYNELIDVHFAHVGQCDPGDCDAQREYFDVLNPDKQNAAWGYKYLVDVDGNAFSGRFYAFLKSMSLVYKMAIFREWHEEWLKPWVHYIPLSLHGAEYVESVRYFHDEEEGRVQAARLAVQGREWADRVLRKEDFEVWLFRLLLESVH